MMNGGDLTMMCPICGNKNLISGISDTIPTFGTWHYYECKICGLLFKILSTSGGLEW